MTCGWSEGITQFPTQQIYIFGSSFRTIVVALEAFAWSNILFENLQKSNHFIKCPTCLSSDRCEHFHSMSDMIDFIYSCNYFIWNEIYWIVQNKHRGIQKSYVHVIWIHVFPWKRNQLHRMIKHVFWSREVSWTQYLIVVQIKYWISKCNLFQGDAKQSNFGLVQRSECIITLRDIYLDGFDVF